MNIIIYGINFSPELVGIGKYTGEMAEWLAQNHNLTIITAPKYYPEWKLDQSFRRWWYQSQDFNGNKIYRCPIWVPKKPTGLKRILHLLSFSITSLPILLLSVFRKPDIIIAIAPPFTSTPLIILSSWMAGFKRILHIQDFEIDAAFTLGLLNNSYLNRFLLRIEKWILRKFDLVSTISPLMQNNLIKKIGTDTNTYLFPNWVDTELIKPIANTKYLRNELDLPSDSPIGLYSGNIGFKQGLENVLLTAEQFQKEGKNLLFLIVGDGAAKESLMDYARSKQLNNVMFKVVQPIDIFLKILATADMHLVMQNSSIADYVMPSKLAAILSSGGYSIITADDDTQLGKLVKEFHIGKLVKPDSAPDLFEALVAFLDNNAQHDYIRKNARDYAVEHLSKNKILENFENRIKQLV
jgi:colanic acid biosynthesis glycosyl transferase WcaI